MITIDSKAFEKQLDVLRGAKLQAIARGALYEAASVLAEDIVEKSPSIPLDEGTLQASIAIHIDEDLKMKPLGKGIVVNGPERSRPKWITRATVSVNTPYAHRLHEGDDFEFQQKKGTEGAHYVEAKAQAYSADYLKILRASLGDRIDAALKGAKT